MNTISLVLNGRTAADIALLPEKQRSNITTLTRPSTWRTMSGSSLNFSRNSSISTISAPPSPALSGRTWSTSSRPGSSRRSSKGSPGWYNTENNLTLDDFARRLNTTSKKLEIWQGKCAQSVVMALMRPTPLVLFVLNPVALVIWCLVGWWWFSGRGVEV